MELDTGNWSTGQVGAFGAFCLLLGTIFTQLLGLRKTTMQLLADRVAKLESDLKAERDRCDEKLSEYRHALRNADAKVAALQHLAGVKPDAFDELVRRELAERAAADDLPMVPA